MVTKIVTKMQPPDVTAQIFWLINRRSDDWKKNGKDPVDSDNSINTVDFEYKVVKKKKSDGWGQE